MTKVPTLPLRRVIGPYAPKRRVSVTFPEGEGKTKQEFKDECDINNIVRRYEQTGTYDLVNRRPPQYADVTGADFRMAVELVADARSAFEELPARVRERFDNDPAALMDFLDDEGNREEAAELGLLSPEAVNALAEERLSDDAKRRSPGDEEHGRDSPPRSKGGAPVRDEVPGESSSGDEPPPKNPPRAARPRSG